MRSRSGSLEDVTEAKPARQWQHADVRRRSAEREEPSGRAERRSRHREAAPGDTRTVQRNHKTVKNGGNSGSGNSGAKSGQREKGRDLSRDDLVFLLSLLEGELQARDEVITVLKAEKMDVALLEAKYGFVTPQKVLQALQRDAIQGKTEALQEDVYERPMFELDKLVEKQRETHRRMLEQLLLVEQSHKRALFTLEDEKRNHGEFMKKSDDFTNLLEQERERLKLLIDQEKAYQERKDEENDKKVAALKEELTKLKSFALMVVDEQQRLTEQLGQQTAKAEELNATSSRTQEELGSARARLQEEELRASRLEVELREQAARHHQEQEGMAAKLAGEDAQNRLLRQRLSAMGRRAGELEEADKALRRAEDELQELRDKIARGECGVNGGNSGLVSELEELRKRVLEMEGKDEELVRMEEHCRDLNRKLEKEAEHSRGLKGDVDELNQRITDLEKLEEAFGKSKQECGVLKSNLEKERAVSKVLTGEVEVLKVRVRELEAAEGRLVKAELALKEDLTKLKTLTVVLADERRAAAEKLRQMEGKVQSSTGRLRAERDKVTSVTEKLIEESKRALHSKAELEEKVRGSAREADDLKARLKAEEGRSSELGSKLAMAEKRLQSLEAAAESEFLKAKEEKTPNGNHFQQEDNKVRELTQEVERLRRKLKDTKMAEGESLKAEEAESRKEISKKKESSQESVLYNRLKEEEAKSSHLTGEVAALKEKIHDYMGTEEAVRRAKAEHSTLQRKLMQQEVRNKELAREMESLTRELERYRRFSKSLRPGMNGRRFSDLHVSSKEVQTDPPGGDDDTAAEAALERAVVNGKLYDENEMEEGVNYGGFAKCSPSLIDSLNNDLKRARGPFLKNQAGGKTPPPLQPPLRLQNGDRVRPGDVVLTRGAGQPLHIKVTPDHGHNTATLEIASPTADGAQSFTSTAVIPTGGGGGPPKQRITIIQNAMAVSPTAKPVSPTAKVKCSPPPDDPCLPCPPFVASAFARTTTPDSCGSVTPDRALSPMQITAAGAPERPGGRRANGAAPSVITTEDNKIHIHLGAPFEPRTQVLTTCTPTPAVVRNNGKMTSSITIKPASNQIQRPAHITIPPEAFRRPGPTRIPKPKGCGTIKPANGSAVTMTTGLHGKMGKEPGTHGNSNPNLVNRRL